MFIFFLLINQSYFTICHISLTELFGPLHRPIVEFAVDNVQTLRKRSLKINDQLQKVGDDHTGVRQNDRILNSSVNSNKENPKKRKSRDDKKSREDQETSRKTVEGIRAPDRDATEENRINKKKQRIQAREDKNHQERKQYRNGSVQRKTGTADVLNPISSEQNDELSKRRKVKGPKEEGPEGKTPKKRKRTNKKDALGHDAVDKLDVLIEQYRSKFSQKSSDKSDGEMQGSRQQMRRWFQT